jgi:hypothetical protein
MAGLKMKYFVLNPRSKHAHDPYATASRVAMEAYAKEIRSENPDLAYDLKNWSTEEHFREGAIQYNNNAK